MKKSLIVVALALVSVFGISVPAHASGATVYVENHASSAWPVWAGAEYTDQYTGSHFVLGTCRTGYRCVKVYEKEIHSYWVAVTQYPHWPNVDLVTIYVNPADDGYSYSKKEHTVAHEFGHAMGLYYHSKYCSNIMYSNLTCNGHLAGWSFSSYAKNILAKN